MSIEKLIELAKHFQDDPDMDCSDQADVIEALTDALPDLEALRWRYVETDGLPHGEGEYEVCVPHCKRPLLDELMLVNEKLRFGRWRVYAWRPRAPKPPEKR